MVTGTGGVQDVIQYGVFTTPPKTIRYRLSADRSVKGVWSPSFTVETLGCTEEELLELFDSLSVQVGKRYPFIEEAK